MKITVKQPNPPAAYNQWTLEIQVQSPQEREMLWQLFSHNVTIPEVLKKAGVLTGQQYEDMQGMMAELARGIPPL